MTIAIGFPAGTVIGIWHFGQSACRASSLGVTLNVVLQNAQVILIWLIPLRYRRLFPRCKWFHPAAIRSAVFEISSCACGSSLRNVSISFSGEVVQAPKQAGIVTAELTFSKRADWTT